MDIKEQIEKVFNSVNKSQSALTSFKKAPESFVKKILGNAIPSDVISKNVEGVKAKLGLDKISGIAEGLGGLFKK